MFSWEHAVHDVDDEASVVVEEDEPIADESILQPLR
jgi:hypothetical protein